MRTKNCAFELFKSTGRIKLYEIIFEKLQAKMGGCETCLLKRCCCCGSLRTGTLVAGAGAIVRHFKNVSKSLSKKLVSLLDFIHYHNNHHRLDYVRNYQLPV